MGTLESTLTHEAESRAESFFSIDRESITLVPLETPREQRLYYGWYMLLMAMCASIASSPGQTFGVSIFNEPLRTDLGLTHGQLGLAYMLGTQLGALPIIWIGLQMDRYGIRRTLLAVVICFSSACFLMAAANSWFHVVICFTLLRMLGPGALSLLSGNILPFWFSRRLGTVEGLRQTAMAMAMAVIPPLNIWLVATFGWRNAYAILGGSIFVLLFPLYWRFFRAYPGEVGQAIDGGSTFTGPGARFSVSNGQADSNSTGEELEGKLPPWTLRDAVRTRAFWLLLSGTSLFGMIQTGVFFNLVPILSEHGLNERHAASMLVAFAVSLAIHQMLGGWLADRWPARVLAMGGMILFAAGLVLLWHGHSVNSIIAAGIVLGAAQGTYLASTQPLWARYFGRSHIGKLRGVQMSTNVAISSFGPLLVGICYDVLGGFDAVLMAFLILPIPFAVGSFWLAAPIRQNNLGSTA